MMNDREDFYKAVVSEMIKKRSASILVCGGGETDKRTLESLGFTEVTISNVDERMKGDEYAPFRWKYENAESLSFDAESFDFVIIHDAIHHASSPHRVLTEMYRVARNGVLAIEARDSFVMWILEKSQFSQTYEHSAVYYNDCRYGGVNNTEIPNYIYRWTEREVEKTIKSYAPYAEHKFCYRYGTSFPCTSELEKKARLKLMFLNFMQPFFWFFVKLFPRQQNLFAFYIEKPTLTTMLFPWLKFNEEGGLSFNREWGEKRYRSPTSRRS